MRKEITVSEQDAREIIYHDHEDFEVECDDVVDNSRWSIHHTCVVKQKSTGLFFSVKYSVGSTEYQDERAFQGDKTVTFKEVFKVKKISEVWSEDSSKEDSFLLPVKLLNSSFCNGCPKLQLNPEEDHIEPVCLELKEDLTVDPDCDFDYPNRSPNCPLISVQEKDKS